MTSTIRLLTVLLTAMFALLLTPPVHAQWVQTPFGPAWAGDPKLRPAAPVVVIPPKPAPFVPVFEVNVTIITNANGVILSTDVNEDYFATKATAATVCKILKCLAVTTEPMFALGPYRGSADIRYLIWADGLKENAGILASYWKADRNPEDKFPGLALKLVNDALAVARKDLQNQ